MKITEKNIATINTNDIPDLNENNLCIVAEQHPDDHIASAAMRLLRQKFDETYDWCFDCDGLVCKEKDCCLNKLPTP